MKKIYFLLTMLLAVTMAWSQKTWDGGAGNSQWSSGNNWNPNGVPGAGDEVLLNTGTPLSITAVPGQTVAKLTITNNTTVTFSGGGGGQTLTIANGAGADLVIDNGSSLTQNASFENITLANDASATIAGTYTVFGTYVLTGTNVVSTVTGSLDNRGAISGATALKLLFNGGTYFHGLNGGTIPTAAWNTGSTVNLSGMTNAFPGGMGQTFVNLTFSSDLTGTVNMNTSFSCTGDFTMSNVTDANYMVLSSTGTSRTISVGGNYLQSSGNLRLASDDGDATLDIAGGFEIQGGTLDHADDNNAGDGIVRLAGNFQQSGGTITETEMGTAVASYIFDGTAEQTFTKSGGTISNNVNFSISSGAIVNFGTSVLNGSTGTFTLNAGGKIITGHASGLGAAGSIQVTGTKTFNSGADYEFRGATTGVFTTSTNPQVRDFTINNASGDVTLSQPMRVNGVLTLTDGALLSNSTNFLNLWDGATVSGVSNASFVSGPIRKTGNDAFVFPVGRVGSGYVPIGISAPGSTASFFTAEYLKTTPPGNTNITAPGITRISFCDYWTLDHTGGETVDVTLNWNANNPCNGMNYVTNPASIKAVHYNGTSWNTASPQNGTGLSGAGSVTWVGVNAFSPFALGTTATTASENPLPVLFDNVKAYLKNNGVQIEWSNLTERDLVNYTIERSVNGRDYSAISVQLPKSNLNDKADYTEFDGSPVSGANFYRIRVQEVSGKVIYSKVLRVETGVVTKGGFNVYPNPLTGRQFTLALTGVNKGQYAVRVVNNSGQDIYQKGLTMPAGGLTQTLELPAAVKPGVYTIVITGDGYLQSKLFIVQ